MVSELFYLFFSFFGNFDFLNALFDKKRTEAFLEINLAALTKGGNGITYSIRAIPLLHKLGYDAARTAELSVGKIAHRIQKGARLI